MRPWWMKFSMRAEEAGDGGASGGGGAGEGNGGDSGDAASAGESAQSGAPPIVGQGADPGTRSPAPADWPDDWRAKASGGDDKKMQRLQRYSSPQAVADALFAAQSKIDSGAYKLSLPADAKPEEIAAYRASLGIPESADKYDLTGVEIGETEKPMVDKFRAHAHALNLTPEQLKGTLKGYFEISEATRAERAAKDIEYKNEAEDRLRANWGNDFRANINNITNYLDSKGIREQLLIGRLADGRPIGSSPEILTWLADIARAENPLGITTPSGQTQMASINDEIAKIEEFMRKDRKAYDRDNSMQDRYLKLLNERLKQQAKQAA